MGNYIRLAEGQSMSVKLAAGAQTKIGLDTNLTDIAYSCSNNGVIVDAAGVVTGIKGGMSVIAAYSLLEPQYKVNLVVTVS